MKVGILKNKTPTKVSNYVFQNACPRWRKCFCPVHGKMGAGLWGSKISLRSIGYEPYHLIMKGSTWVNLANKCQRINLFLKIKICQVSFNFELFSM